MIKWITLLLFLNTICSYSQNSEYDSIYKKITRELVVSEPENALVATDYLYEISGDYTEKINALLLKASILRQNGLRVQSIKVIEEADDLATANRDYTYIARINGQLSTLYRESGITSSGKKALKKAIKAGKRVQNPDESYKFQGNLQMELAYYEMDNEAYEQAIIYLIEAEKFFKKMDKSYDIPFFMASTDELIGKNYIQLQKPDSAFYYLKQAKEELKDSKNPDSPLMGFIYNNLGCAYMLKGDFDNAYINYLRALDIAEISNFYNLKMEVYSDLQDYYKHINDNENYLLYSEKLNALVGAEIQLRETVANKLVQSLQEKESEILKRSRTRLLLISAGCLFVISLTFGVYHYRRKQDYKRFREIIDKKGSIKTVTGKIPHKVRAEDKADMDTDKNYMPKETEAHILKSLKKFERTKCFLDKKTSLTSVSAQIEVNNRYLSYVIKKHKQKDFSSYINELRINHIVDCLKNKPDYLKYKISYLAEQSGFSSHTRFTLTFKKVTGIAPSTFIQLLKKEKKKIQPPEKLSETVS